MALSMARAQKEGYKVVILDTEGAWDEKFISRWGLDPNNVLYVYSPWVDDIKVVVSQLIDSDEDKFALVLDSVGGLDKKKIFDDALSGDPKADQGGLAKDLKPLYKLILNLVKQKNSIAISAGHYYGQPGAYGDAQEIAGGKALKLLPDVIISLKKAKMFDANKNVIGNELKAITLKNRLYPPFSEATIQIDFENGLNRFAGLADLAVEAGLVKKGGAGWYTVTLDDGTETKLQGDNKLIEFFREKEEEFIDNLNKFVKETGFSTVNEELQKAEALVNNIEEDK